MFDQTKKTVGLILTDISSSFRDSFLDELSTQFEEKGFQLIIGLTNYQIEREKDYLVQFSQLADCIIVVSCAEQYVQIADAVTEDTPLIFLFDQPEGCPHISILQSDYSAIYQAIVSHTNEDIKKVGCVCSHRNLSSSREFLRAYKDALETSTAEYDEDLIYDIADDLTFDAQKLILDIAEKDCHCIMATTPAITNRLLDYLIFYNNNALNRPISLFGFGTEENRVSKELKIDAIVHPTNLIIDLAVQQAIYLVNHPNTKQKGRPYLVKGKLRMHAESNSLHFLEK